ncbi:hypothetical protein WJX72_008690 [[Myrmecia] bisecta]|uniref:Translocator protein n=1 Tax=[Myrmecia] bisecta TaxID=41462 RepID=A0AAW1Q7S5_9CHLO
MVLRFLSWCYDAVTLVLFVGAPLAASVAIDRYYKRDVQSWYKQLRKPSWQPPEWVYGAAWPLMYTMMGTAAWMVTQHGGVWGQQWPTFLYTLQLALNLAWPVLFFGMHRLDLALVDSCALMLAIAATMRAFNRVEPLTATMLVPYLLWTAFATVLNYDTWARNPEASTLGLLKRAKLEAIREPKVGASGVEGRHEYNLRSHEVQAKEE